MRIDIISSVPELMTSPLNESILRRAQEKGFVEIVIHNLHDYAHDRRKTTDDYPFGGEAGMVMKCEPVFELVEKLQNERSYDEIIYTSPDGVRYDQHEANRLSTLENIIILCGHYKGIDHRIREHLITREISIGDYVLTGGELAACIIADSVVRLIPGAIGDEASALTDSFQDNLLAPPVYTRPAEFRGWRVPDVLLSGNFAEIEKWQDGRSSAGGGSPTCCCRATSPRSRSGRTNRPSSAPAACAPTCSKNNRRHHEILPYCRGALGRPPRRKPHQRAQTGRSRSAVPLLGR